MKMFTVYSFDGIDSVTLSKENIENMLIESNEAGKNGEDIRVAFCSIEPTEVTDTAYTNKEIEKTANVIEKFLKEEL